MGGGAFAGGVSRRGVDGCGSGGAGGLFAPSLLRAKARLFAALRDTGLTVPAQVVWGSHDPLTSVDQGLWLFRAIAARQPAAQFHLINRAGALPFREEPAAFAQVVRAFADGLGP